MKFKAFRREERERGVPAGSLELVPLPLQPIDFG